MTDEIKFPAAFPPSISAPEKHKTRNKVCGFLHFSRVCESEGGAHRQFREIHNVHNVIFSSFLSYQCYNHYIEQYGITDRFMRVEIN